MDAAEIAAIRERAKQHGPYTNIVNDLIALCDLAAEALEYRAGTNMLADAFRAASANPKHERRG